MLKGYTKTSKSSAANKFGAKFTFFTVIFTMTTFSDCDYSCHFDEYQCGNCKCVNAAYYCDKVNDCGDFSDEPQNCSKSEFAFLLKGVALSIPLLTVKHVRSRQ